jgi:hypothetical protein
MADNTEKKKGSILGKLILLAIFFVAGGVVGRTSVGEWAEKMYNTIRYSKAEVAENFLSKPAAFDLTVEHRQNDQGQLETYLVNVAKHEMLPVYEVKGTTQVGKAEHRMIGLKDQLLEDAKEGGSAALEKAKQLLEFLDK